MVGWRVEDVRDPPVAGRAQYIARRPGTGKTWVTPGVPWDFPARIGIDKRKSW